jgi:hypothetical protein
MSGLRLRRPSFALVVSIIALSVALGGTSYAAFTLPNNSVGAEQLKSAAVTTKKIKNGAVTGAKVKLGTLVAANFKAGQLPRGAQGLKGDSGPQGPKGDPGPPGPNGTNGATNVVVRLGSPVAVANGTQGTATASCEPGERATGGGSATSGVGPGWAVEDSFPLPLGTPTEWEVSASNNTGSTNNLQASVICASP